MVPRNLKFKFTLVSYNILSQTLLYEHSFLYSSCNQKDLEWPRRGQRIVSELLNNRADIICLQEVELEHLQNLYRPKLALYGYDCLYKKKTGYKIDGCAIFYKSKLFQLISYRGIEFNRTDITYLLNRDNVGLIAVLKPKVRTRSKSSQLVVANTHLIFNPRRDDIKLAQLKYFLQELEEFSLKRDSLSDKTTSADASTKNPVRSYHPTILCGDLNSKPNSVVSKYILRETTSLQRERRIDNSDETVDNEEDEDNDDDEGPSTNNQSRRNRPAEENEHTATAELEEVNNDNEEDDNNLVANNSNRDADARASKAIKESSQSISDSSDSSAAELNSSHSFEFKSVYPTHNRFGARYVSTFSSCVVDHIFYTPKLRLESYRELLTEEQLRNIGALPNYEFPSDHLSLEAKFTLE